MSVDLTECDREPIHLPGAIQPHGALLALDEPALTVTHVSVNVRELLHVEPDAALGRRLENVLDDEVCSAVRAALSRPRPWLAPLPVERGGLLFDGLVHRHRGAAILELERKDAATCTPPDAALREALGRVQAAGDWHQLGAAAVEDVRLLTGFDRVMLYRFDPDDEHGAVVDEARAAGVESFLGLHYPASDIPWQARALYVSNWLRLIPDIEYTPVPIVPGAGATEARPLDLSFALLRSVSPVHVEYLRNMKVRASMSISIVRDQRLVALIACHHSTPRYVPSAVRSACELLARVISLKLAAVEELSAKARLTALRRSGAVLADAMRAATGEPTSALLGHGAELLRLVNAPGAAIRNSSGLHLVGSTPKRKEVEDLVAWLERGGSPVVSTSFLCRLYPAAHDLARHASGLLAIAIPTRPPAFVVWFRPELRETVCWAGDPTPPRPDPLDQRIRPRRSFDVWKELVTGQSARWTAEEIEVAEDLRRCAVEVDLVRQVRRAENAIEVRDELMAIVSHDLKNPLNVIEMAAHLLADRAQDPLVDRISRAADNMERLIGDLLDLAKIEGGRFTISPRAMSAKAIVEDGVGLIEAVAEQKHVRVEVAAADIRIHADAQRVLQVLSNLLGNAIKFTPVGGTIRIGTEPEGDWVRFTVEDSGPGIAASELPHVFERYWQGRGASRHSVGLGLYIAKGIVDAHGGRIWVESRVGRGSTFHFTLPRVSRGDR